MALSENTMPPRQILFLALTPFACGYFLSYLLRAVNAVVAPELVAELELSATQLGLITSAYLFAFALFQMPLGVLLDRYGPRRVQTALLLTASVGIILFATGQSVTMLTIGRALMGLGFAGGLMAGFKAVQLWLPSDRRPMYNALVMCAGAIGLLVATRPTQILVESYGWRHVSLGYAAITAIVAVVIYVVVPRRADDRTSEGLVKQISEAMNIYRDGVFWRIAPILGLSAGYNIAVQTLWAGPWFRDVAGYSETGVGYGLLVMALAFFFGILGSGYVADRLYKRGWSVLSVMNLFLLSYLLSQAIILLGDTPLTLFAWALFGIGGQSAVLAYPWLATHFGHAKAGRAHAAANLFIFATAFVVQYVTGVIIDLFPGAESGGYDPHAYRVAFGLFLLAQILAAIWYFQARLDKLYKV